MSNDFMRKNLTGYSTQKFTDFYPNKEAFLKDYNEVGIPTTIKEKDVSTLYFLLYGSYANSTIVNSDVNQFKYRLFTKVFEYGGVWVRKLEIRERLLKMNEEEILGGSKAIYNAAANPSTAPTTAGTEELPFINAQNTTKYKRPVMEGYENLWAILRTDITKDFIDKFKDLFIPIVIQQTPVLYEDDDEEGEYEEL